MIIELSIRVISFLSYPKPSSLSSSRPLNFSATPFPPPAPSFLLLPTHHNFRPPGCHGGRAGRGHGAVRGRGGAGGGAGGVGGGGEHVLISGVEGDEVHLLHHGRLCQAGRGGVACHTLPSLSFLSSSPPPDHLCQPPVLAPSSPSTLSLPHLPPRLPKCQDIALLLHHNLQHQVKAG